MAVKTTRPKRPRKVKKKPDRASHKPSRKRVSVKDVLCASDLNDRELTILKMTLINEQYGYDTAWSTKEIAEHMNTTSRAINTIQASDRFQRALVELQAPVIDMITYAQRRAAKKLISLLESKDERISLRAAEIILKPILPTKTELSGSVGVSVGFEEMLALESTKRDDARSRFNIDDLKGDKDHDRN